MKTIKLFTTVTAALASILLLNQPNLAETKDLTIKNNFTPDPLTIMTGNSGGSVKSNCGNINNQPSQVINVTEPVPYARLTVESQGQPTLLIDGPGGRFCVQADNYSGGKAELSGYWPTGVYKLYVGDLSAKRYSYTLYFSQQKK